MSADLSTIQRIVLRGGPWAMGQQLMVHADEERGNLRRFLARLKAHRWPHGADDRELGLQVSVGLTRRGLQRAGVPPHVLALLAYKAPAFSAGAAHRAAVHTGACGQSSPHAWADPFRDASLAAVISVHADSEDACEQACQQVTQDIEGTGLRLVALAPARRLETPPPGLEPVEGAQWVHFGFRDGLSRIGIEGVTPADVMATLKPFSKHQLGEFVLGHPEDSGAMPWLSGPGAAVWPAPWRDFFRNGSFGVLMQVEQYVDAFERFVAANADAAESLPLPGDDPDQRILALKAKLCGRHPDGRPLGDDTQPEQDFDYQRDPRGERCPFGSHVRRMNPRTGAVAAAASEASPLAHGFRSRALIRRGMPYGKAWRGDSADGVERGLMGQFFCASIEDQFEHLLGQWADRVPMGSPDEGGARDPLIGAHEVGDGPFELPQGEGAAAAWLYGLTPFTRTRGMAYLLYPSQSTLAAIVDSDPFVPPKEDRG